MTMIFQLIMKLLTDKASLSALRYWKSVTICEIDPEDMRYLGVKENQNVKITTDYARAVHDYVDFSETNSNLYKVPYPPDCFIRSIPSRIPPVVFAILDHSSSISGINLDV